MNIYKDIETRTNGEIYIGVVGPVRTGKSTFIKRFMELMVLPAIADDNNRKRPSQSLSRRKRLKCCLRMGYISNAA